MQHYDDFAEDQPLDGRTVLVVEDQERLRTVIAMMVEDLGAIVRVVDDGRKALEIYRSDAAGIDLVLMDLKMAGIDGGSAYREMLTINPEVKVVLSSGMSPGPELTELLAAHNGGFIEKPFKLDGLEDVLTTVLSGGHAVRRSE